MMQFYGLLLIQLPTGHLASMNAAVVEAISQEVAMEQGARMGRQHVGDHFEGTLRVLVVGAYSTFAAAHAAARKEGDRLAKKSTRKYP
jgi:hypothetical protein